MVPREEPVKPRLMPIDNGTVLDHLPMGSALKIVQLLGLDVSTGAVTLAMNTESAKKGRKDLLFVENIELSQTDLDKIGLIAEGATWNTIRNKSVQKKQRIALPEQVQGVLKCPNPLCITNAEPVKTRFRIESNPLQAVCGYCERTVLENDLLKNIQ